MRKLLSFAFLASILMTIGLQCGCAFFNELTLRPQLQSADEAFNKKEYSLAATRYESLSDRYPESSKRQMLIIRQGMALYKIASYHNARDIFLAYLKDYPEGFYKKDAQDYLNKIDVLMSTDNAAQKEALEGAKKDLNQLQQLQIAHSHDPAVRYAIGNLYYELGNYEEAVRYYYQALTMDAAYKEKYLIKQRMVIDANGNPKPRSAAEIRRIERENQPLVVFNTHNYTARDKDTLLSNQKRFYNVTGLIRNQSSRLLRDVKVEVSFQNAQHQILDSQLVYVGSMGPDEVRPFRAEANSYDDLYNITSFEIVPQWSR